MLHGNFTNTGKKRLEGRKGGSAGETDDKEKEEIPPRTIGSISQAARSTNNGRRLIRLLTQLTPGLNYAQESEFIQLKIT